MLKIRFRKKLPEPIIEPTEAQKQQWNKLKLQYVEFCKGPFFTTDKQREAFDALCQEPDVVTFGFTPDSPSSFVFATTPVTLKHPKGKHDYELGEFIVTIRRNIHAPSECTFLFERVNPPESINGSRPVIHPHINADGILCIGTGKEEIVLAIRQGNLLEAVRSLIFVLHSYNPATAYGNYRVDENPSHHMQYSYDC